MEFKDYYKTMGVAEDASQDEIKRAYRKLARKYHPDVSKEANADTKFKEMGEAYEVLKDPKKRSEYDQLRAGGWQGGQEFTPPPGWQYEAETGTGPATGGFTGGAAPGFSEFFETLFGGGHGFHRDAGTRREFTVRGQDMHYQLQLSLRDAFHGTTRGIQLQTPVHDANGQLTYKTRTLQVKIPKGVVQDQQIRLKGQGGPGIGSAPNGDLYLQIKIQADPLFRLEGRDIYLTLPVTPWEAALGATVAVPTLGGEVNLKIPPNSQGGQKLRLAKRGFPGEPAGSQYVLLQIAVPPPRTEQQRELYRQLAEQFPEDPRSKLRG